MALKLQGSFVSMKEPNWDEVRKTGVEAHESPFCNQISKEPRMRISVIAMTVNAMSESAEL